MPENTCRKVAMVLAQADRVRESSCERLDREGYDVLGFSRVADAQAWLEEDTPTLALVGSAADPFHNLVMATLYERRVNVSIISE